MKNIPLLLVTILGTLALVIGVAVVFSRNTQQVTSIDRGQIENGARLVKGPDTAKVVIVEFSDFQCPACRAIEPLVKQVATQYPNDVKIIYRHFPLTQIHPYAQIAAQASEVAADQGKFWEMHDILFDRQDQWTSLGSQEAVIDTLATYAQELGIDKQVLTEKIQSDSIKSNVAQDVSLATQLKVDATPTIYVNGQKVTAPQQLMTIVADQLK